MRLWENAYADVSRAFLLKHGAYKYRMKKVSEMSDNAANRYCHWFCERLIYCDNGCEYFCE